ncbi:PDZ domain-containing protein [Streptomyces sp. NPDC001595]|uniref:PDZ domain-containing protein n=1 Tax=Streptomyces sp. NPDC001532 TaxID=3154520 RepID=UPI00332CF02E
MEQTALRPKPMPGQEPGGASRPGGTARRPHAARRRGRRLTTLLLGLCAAMVLLLAGIGLGTVGATVIGMSRLAELQQQAGRAGQAGGAGQPGSAPAVPLRPSARSGPGPHPAPQPPVPSPAKATLGVEVADAEKPGAEVVAVHVPGPGFTAGLVRGDVLLTFDGARVDSAADLVRAVGRAEPGQRVTVTVRHRSGGYQQLTVAPGVVT